jgi:hypothetical protein
MESTYWCILIHTLKIVCAVCRYILELTDRVSGAAQSSKAAPSSYRHGPKWATLHCGAQATLASPPGQASMSSASSTAVTAAVSSAICRLAIWGTGMQRLWCTTSIYYYTSKMFYWASILVPSLSHARKHLELVRIASWCIHFAVWVNLFKLLSCCRLQPFTERSHGGCAIENTEKTSLSHMNAQILLQR